MRKNYLYLLLFVITLQLSCNKDDKPAAPSEFEITTEASFKSVELSWTLPEGENNQNLKYAVFLNNELIIENNEERAYTIEELELATNYNLRVVAKNDIGETQVETSFETLNPDNYLFQLESYQNGQSNPVIRYSYFTNGLISAARDPSEYGERVTYQYDQDGNLLSERVWGYDYGGFADFTYNNNQLVDFGSSFGQGDSYSVYNFVSPDNYFVYGYFFNNIISSREVILERSNGKITSCQITDLDTQEITFHKNYFYKNENLIETINLLNGDVWNYEYDDKHNFAPNKGYHRKPGLGMSHISPIYEAYFISGVPQFVDHFPKNNPTFAYKNGELMHTFTYEYTEFDYPSRIYVNDSEDPAILTYTYFPN